MRKYHRWISVFFGIFMLWIAATGVAIQAVPLFAGGGDDDHDRPAAAAAPSAPAGFKCPETMMCRPKQRGGAGNIKGFIQHLHSGETFGPVGTVISILSGLALVFFSISGIWMYVQMWRNRASRGISPRWFWK